MVEDPSVVAPAVALFGISGCLALGFGAGYGARSYSTSQAFKDLLEKFPEPPTPEAQAFARSGATRALLAGTGLAALMGAGAVAIARSYGVKSAADFGTAVSCWLPSRERLQGGVDALEPLQRKVTENLQSARDVAGQRFQSSSVGGYIASQAGKNKDKPMEDWEKELVQRLEVAASGGPKPPTK